MKTEVRKSPTVAASAPPERPPARRSRRSTRQPATHTFCITRIEPGWTTGTGLMTALVTDETGQIVGLFQITPALDTPGFRAGLRRAVEQATLEAPDPGAPLRLVSSGRASSR